VIFGQVREDAAVEMAALQEAVRGVNAPVVFSIASGGCTAFSLLAAVPQTRLFAVDVNLAQIHLLRLKQAILLNEAADAARWAVSKDAGPAFATVSPYLDPATCAYWDARPRPLARGLNHCGIVDRALTALVGLFHRLFQPRSVTEALLRAESLEEQAKVYRTRWNRAALALAFHISFSRAALAFPLGTEYVRHLPREGAARQWQRLDALFLRHPARTNPYLWQLFAGRYPPAPDSLPPYLRPENLPSVRRGLERAEFHHVDATGFLESIPPGSIHFFALSNILDGSTPLSAHRLLQAAAQAAAPGAVLSVRFFTTPPDGWESWLPKRLIVDSELSDQAEGQDRSVFCRFIRILRRVEGPAA
jgi:S-adenosylmethionine-diacylglycerol 3-amino-3-carboxypropyl transferase